MNKKNFDVALVGMALFAMFFGAGNLIFPPYMGFLSGSVWSIALLGFLITGIGMPLMGIIAAARAGGTVEHLAGRVGPRFARALSIVVILAIGPLLAIPRTAATTFEMGVRPNLPWVPPAVSSVIFFVITLFFALNRATARLGTAAALILSPILIETSFGWTTAPWVAAVAMSVGFLFFVVYAGYDRRFTPRREKGSLLDPDEVFHIGDLGRLLLNPTFLFVVALCVTFYSAIFPFQSFCPDFLHHKFGLSTKTSGALSSLIIWGTIIFTPLFGRFVDRRGKRASLMLYGSAMLLVSHVVLALTPAIRPVAVVFMVVLGIAFSMVPASMWPSVALIVNEKRLGTGYGLMTSIQNLGLWAFPILAGWITDVVNRGAPKGTPLDYTYTILMFATLGLFGLLFAFLLKRADRQAGGRLERP